nr:phosphoenolpyruvate carboxylase 2 [Tanacetum cinerariifolium]
MLFGLSLLYDHAGKVLWVYNVSHRQVQHEIGLQSVKVDELRIRANLLFHTLNDDVKHYIEFWKQIPLNVLYRIILGYVRDKKYDTREYSRLLLATGDSDIPEDQTFTSVNQ